MINVGMRFRLLVASNAALPVPAEFIYDPEDPMVVEAIFHAAGDSVHWNFSRELLVSGLLDDCGDGDVRIWSSSGKDEEDLIYISLNSPEGKALLEGSRAKLQEFLDATYEICPAGEEVIDWDDVIAQLLDEL